jgi:hypothetical protein
MRAFVNTFNNGYKKVWTKPYVELQIDEDTDEWKLPQTYSRRQIVVGVTVENVHPSIDGSDVHVAIQTRGCVNVVVCADSVINVGTAVYPATHMYEMPNSCCWIAAPDKSDGRNPLGHVHSHAPGAKYAVVRLHAKLGEYKPASGAFKPMSDAAWTRLKSELANRPTAAGHTGEFSVDFADTPAPAETLTDALVALSDYTHNDVAESGLSVVCSTGPALSSEAAGVTVESGVVHVAAGTAGAAFFGPVGRKRKRVHVPAANRITGMSTEVQTPFANSTLEPNHIRKYQKCVREAMSSGDTVDFRRTLTELTTSI